MRGVGLYKWEGVPTQVGEGTYISTLPHFRTPITVFGTKTAEFGTRTTELFTRATEFGTGSTEL